MKKILLIIAFSTIGYVGSSQLQLISVILQRVDLGRVNEVKNTLLRGGIATVQVAEIVDAVKLLKQPNYDFDYLEAPIAEPLFTLNEANGYDLTKQLQKSLRK